MAERYLNSHPSPECTSRPGRSLTLSDKIMEGQNIPEGVHLQCERSLGTCQVHIVDSEGVKPAASKVPYSEAAALHQLVSRPGPRRRQTLNGTKEQRD